MNIFKNTKDLIGDFNEEIHTVREVMLTAEQIRLGLGKKAYLLDTYLSLFFVSANKTLAYESADSGFQEGGELRNFCTSVVDKTGEHKDHPLYEKALEVLNSKQSILTFQERYTKSSLLFIALADDFIDKIVEEYINEQEIRLSAVLDILRLQDLYNDISYIVGEKAMDDLNHLLKRKFIVSSFLATFIQGFTNDLLYTLWDSDIETSKKIFQLTFDDIFSVPEND